MKLYQKTLKSHIVWMNEMIEKIERFMKDIDTYEAFVQDEKTCDAVLIPLIQIWEIAWKIGKLYPDCKEIPYQDIVWMRNILVHTYHKIEPHVIRYTIHTSIPHLKNIIEPMLL